jgi:hypothetical protein
MPYRHNLEPTINIYAIGYTPKSQDENTKNREKNQKPQRLISSCPIQNFKEKGDFAGDVAIRCQLNLMSEVMD